MQLVVLHQETSQGAEKKWTSANLSWGDTPLIASSQMLQKLIYLTVMQPTHIVVS